jgi:hypothetical protein
MDQPNLPPDFDKWILWVFDRPVEEPRGCLASLASLFSRSVEPSVELTPEDILWEEELDPGNACELLTALFENPTILTPRFSDAQINQGLYFLASADSSDYNSSLLEAGVPWELRERGLRSIYTLYRDLFAVKCTGFSGQRKAGSEPENPLNTLCYMWWDITSLAWNTGKPDAAHVDAVILSVLQDTLRLPSLACQNGALHGLGHLNESLRPQATAIIDDYLAQNRSLPKELRAYAKEARKGGVL